MDKSDEIIWNDEIIKILIILTIMYFCIYYYKFYEGDDPNVDISQEPEENLDNDHLDLINLF